MVVNLSLLNDVTDRPEEARKYRELIDTITSRRSIRHYRDEPVPTELIESLLAVALSAPSAHNRQPWRFRVVGYSEKIRLAALMGSQLRTDRLADGDSGAAVDADVARSYARIAGAPAVIVVCLSMEDMDTYPDEKRTRAEYLMAVQSVAMAGQNLLIAAHAAGLGACWMCGPLFCPETVGGALALPTSWQPQGMITLGHPAGPGKARDRRSLNECASGQHQFLATQAADSLSYLTN